jgi:cytochrome c biogenesis protein CcmG, thiol:disulfide interchange protein DsbE
MSPFTTEPRLDRHRPGAARTAVAVLVGAALLLSACSGGGTASGQALPATDLVTLDDGTATSFDAYRGTPLVVNLWASWCTPCRTEMPAIERAHQQLGDRVAIVGLTDDPNLDAARKAAATAGVTYPLLVDTDGRFQSDLGLTGLPATVFVDADGKVVATHNGTLDEAALLDQIGRLDAQS